MIVRYGSIRAYMAPADDATAGTRLVLLGTNGGPLPTPGRWGTSQAVVVDGRVLVVDCGYGVTHQLRKARLLVGLRKVFVTHMHSDHNEDFFNLVLQSRSVLPQHVARLDAYGPGPAGGLAALPSHPEGEAAYPLVNEDDPTPGLAAMAEHQLRAHAYDINIRIRDAGLPSPGDLLAVHEIPVPPEVGASGPDNVAPPMSPRVVCQDDYVVVSAVLVDHAPVFPSFAFRFDTEAGSVVVSGDTAPSANLVTLARGADVLVHEVCDPACVAPAFSARLRRRHMTGAHTSLHDVGRVAGEAGVGRLVLSHFIPSGDVLPDDHWRAGAQANFDGEVIVGKELLELRV